MLFVTGGSITVLSLIPCISAIRVPPYMPIMLSCFEFHPEISLCAVRKIRGTDMCAYLPKTKHTI